MSFPADDTILHHVCWSCSCSRWAVLVGKKHLHLIRHETGGASSISRIPPHDTFIVETCDCSLHSVELISEDDVSGWVIRSERKPKMRKAGGDARAPGRSKRITTESTESTETRPVNQKSVSVASVCSAVKSARSKIRRGGR